jgi:hypothetical protein
MTSKPEHSLTGASAAERWMNCVGYVSLARTLGTDRPDDPEWTKEGKAAHAAISKCLTEGLESWEVLGEEFEGIKITPATVEAIEVMLATVQPLQVDGARVYIEEHLTHPEIDGMYGTIDHGTVAESLATVTDYKHGEGVIVEVENNPQIIYYAYLLLLRHPEVRRCALRIVQPRASHPDGPVRRWVVAAEEICTWVEENLIPAMQRAEKGGELDCGKWCRFCPAKLICPLVTGIFQAAATYDPKALPAMNDAALGEAFRLVPAARFYATAVEREVDRRLRMGRDLVTAKLVPSKTDRVFKDGAEEVFEAQIGEEAFTEPKLKSPAQMEKVSSEAKALVKDWAYQPEGDLKVVPMDDKRAAVKPRSNAEVFAGAKL